MNEQDEYAVIEPAGNVIAYDGRQVEIKPMTTLKCAAFARALKGVELGSLIALGSGNFDGLFDLIADHAEKVLAAIEVASGIPASELGEKTPDEVLPVAVAVFQVNADFFVRRLVPAFNKAANQAGQALSRGPGRTPSNP